MRNHFNNKKYSIYTATVMTKGEEEDHCLVLISFSSVSLEYRQLYTSYIILAVIVQQAAVFICQYTSDFRGFSFPVVSVASPPGMFYEFCFLRPLG